MKNTATGLFVFSLMLSQVWAFSPNLQLDWSWYWGDDKAQTYAENHRSLAIAEMQRTGIPASIKMAQAILESGCGMSELATKARNHFGIKCGGVWAGSKHYVWDDEPQKSCFRVYNSVEESYMAHSDFLLDSAKRYRYGPLFELDPLDYKAWAHGLQKSGYATSKTYAIKLIALIERLELYKLDHLRLEVLAAQEDELRAIFPDLFPSPRLTPVIDLGDSTLADVFIPDPFGDVQDSVAMTLTKQVFEINGLPTVYVQAGDNSKSIARRYKIRERKFLRYNELHRNKRVLRPGQFLFLKKKKKSYTAELPKTHQLRKGQELYDVAQHYGLRLKYLKKLNPTYKKQKPEANAILRLRN